MKEKIFIISSSRADYGILEPLIKNISHETNVKLIITGSHLSKFYGNTYKIINSNGIKINYKIPFSNDKNDEVSISNNISTIIKKLTKIILKENPNIFIILGDRYEIFACAVSAVLNNIPIAHIHGGELTYGSLDNIYRHAITKMSHLHFVTHKTYQKRVVQMGENPKYVFNVGSLSVENLRSVNLLSRKEIENILGFKLRKHNVIITFHPNTISKNNIRFEIDQLLASLSKEKDSLLLFTYSNADAGSKIIIREINKFIKKMKYAYLVKSLGQKIYFSVLKHFDLVIGNSSSGIIEAPSFGINIINIGDRQKGRVMSKKIIQSDLDKSSISNAIKKSKGIKYRKLKNMKQNSFYRKNTSKKMTSLILDHHKLDLFSKKFYNM